MMLLPTLKIREKHLTPHTNKEEVLWDIKPLHVMFYRPFDRSMGFELREYAVHYTVLVLALSIVA